MKVTNPMQAKQINPKKIYIQKKQESQEISFMTSNDIKDYEDISFCHYLNIEGWDTKTLFPNEKITKKENKALQAIIANCLYQKEIRIPILLHQKNYKKGSIAAKSGYGFKPFDKIRKLLEKEGYIKVYAPISFGTDTHPVSWIKGTDALYKKIPSKAEINYRPKFTCLLRGEITGKKKRGHIPFPDLNDPILIEIKGFVKRYHDMLSKHELSCNVPKKTIKTVQSSHMNMKKAGNPPTAPNVNFKYPIVIFPDDLISGSRFYKGFWISIKREYRPFTRIDGEICAEIDFSAMHPNILYQLEGIEPPDSIYIYEKSDKVIISNRDIAKMLLLASINIKQAKTKKLSRLHTVNAVITNFKSKTGIKLKYKDVLKILFELEKKHAPIVKYFYASAWRICTRIESALVQKIIRSAMEKNILLLPVHDSVICKAKNIDTVSEIIKSKTDLKFETKMFK